MDKISDADRKTISDEARRLLEMMLNESSKTISDADRARAEEKYMKRNDGGIARKTRVF
tara:strand:+ start:372 stop:548 length:177 start_codon:yes stop_codon:yes gene_type:complete